MKIIQTENAPSAIGPYSQGMQVDNLVFTSGQIPVDPKTGELITDIAKATKQSLENLKAVLEEAGSSLEKTIKVTVFITDMEVFGQVNEVYGQYFSSHKPARSCVAVKTLPKNSVIEIEAIALK